MKKKVPGAVGYLKEKAEFFTDIDKKHGWNIVTGCCNCKARKTKDDFKDNPEFLEEYVGTCGLKRPPWPLPPMKCRRSGCPIRLRVLIDENKKQPFDVYADPDKPSKLKDFIWRFKQWLFTIRKGTN